MALGSEAALCRALREHVDLEAAERGRAQEVNFRGHSRGKPVEAHETWENHRKTMGKWWLKGILWRFIFKLLHNYGKSQCFSGKLSISMAIFHSCVDLPEGIWMIYRLPSSKLT